MVGMPTDPGLVPPRFANVDIELKLTADRELVRRIGRCSFIWYEVVAPEELPGLVRDARCHVQGAIANMEVNAYTCRARQVKLFGDGRKLAVKLSRGCETATALKRLKVSHRWEERHKDTALESTWRSCR